MTLEQRLDRLDAIVRELESSPLDLASALTLFEEGVTCLREAAGSLVEAEAKVKRLTELTHGAFVVEDLEPDA